MRPMRSAPKDRHILVKMKSIFYIDFEWQHVGYRIAEVFWRDDGWTVATGDDSITSTENVTPVGWWPLPGNEDTTVDISIIPDGWWLYGLFHNHTPTRFKGDKHIPFGPDTKDAPDTPFTAKLQHVDGGRLTAGHGRTPHEALSMAVFAAEQREANWEEVR